MGKGSSRVISVAYIKNHGFPQLIFLSIKYKNRIIIIRVLTSFVFKIFLVNKIKVILITGKIIKFAKKSIEINVII